MLGVILANVMLGFPYNIRRKIAYCYMLTVCKNIPCLWNTLCYGVGCWTVWPVLSCTKILCGTKYSLLPIKLSLLTFPYKQLPYAAHKANFSLKELCEHKSESWSLMCYYAASSEQPIGPILRMRPIGCPETSVIYYHYSLSNDPEERRSE
jgi:hypothetical protein